MVRRSMGGLAVLLPGVPVLPEDFAGRIALLKRATGLSWEGFADALGVDDRQLQRWRHGTEPCGGALFALFELADSVPGGMDLLLRGRRSPLRGAR